MYVCMNVIAYFLSIRVLRSGDMMFLSLWLLVSYLGELNTTILLDNALVIGNSSYLLANDHECNALKHSYSVTTQHGWPFSGNYSNVN